MATTAAATKFNGKVKITINEDGQAVATPIATEGLIQQVMDGVTTILSTQEVAVGTGALVQRLLLVLGGNAIATHSFEGKIGVAALGKSFVVGK